MPAGDELHRYAIDGRLPREVAHPKSVDELSAILASAHQRGWAVVPFGGGSQIALGELPERYDLALSLSGLNRIVAHEPDDMTVTVEAGMTLADLQRHLLGSGQVLPLDPPLPAEATIGGILATRAAGPIRLGYRRIGDHLLGIKVVDAKGVVTKAGGRVVKNVSGYEMGRLYAGSLGTLAVIVEATFKVRPRFEEGAVVLLRCPDFATAQAGVDALIHSDAEPVLLELLGPEPLTLAAGYVGTRDEVRWLLLEAQKRWAGLTRGGDAVQALPWSLAYPRLLQAHRPDASPSLFPGVIADFPPDEFPVAAADDIGVGSTGLASASPLTALVTAPMAEMIGLLERAGHLAAEIGLPYAFAAHAGNGVARLHTAGPQGSDTLQSSSRAAAAGADAPSSGTDAIPTGAGDASGIDAIPTGAGDTSGIDATPPGAGDRFGTDATPPDASGTSGTYATPAGVGATPPGAGATPPETSGWLATVADLIDRWRALAGEVGGSLVVENAPQELKERVSVWGPPGQDFFLHQAIKEKMDPGRTLSPGRFIGRL